MEAYLLLGLALLLLVALFIYWFYRIIKLLKNGYKRAFTLNLTLFLFLLLFIMWELRILPFSLTNDFKNKTEQLTGKKFWSWNNYRFDELGIRGEGYTLEIYDLSSEIANYFKNPGEDFFQKFPLGQIASVKWQKTPVKQEDQEVLMFVTPTYAGWDKEIIDKQSFIREIANKPGSYYSFKKGSTDFYLISPEKKIILWINHNM
jgi:energy-coupling factor transporter transmembrane protein EcfT